MPKILSTYGADSFYLWTVSGFYRSVDGGLTWTTFGSQLNPYNPTALCYDALTSTFWMTTLTPPYSSSIENRLFKSTDDGSSWIEVASGLFSNEPVSCLTVNNESGRLYAGVNIINSGGKIYMSDDGGINWTSVFDSGSDVTHIGISAGHVYALSTVLYAANETNFQWSQVNNIKTDDFIITESGVLYAPHQWGALHATTDIGSTWSPAYDVNTRHGVRAICRDEVNDILFIANDIGLFRSYDSGVSWENISDGIIRTEVSQFLPIENGVLANGYWITGDQGNNWDTLQYPLSVKGIGPDGQLFSDTSRSDDNGINWTQHQISESSSWGYGYAFPLYDTKYYFHPSGAIFAYGTNGMFKSLDNGDTWLWVDYPVPTPYWSGYKIFGDAEGNIFALERGGNLVRSTDEGVSWNEIHASASDCIVLPDGSLILAKLMQFYETGNVEVYSSQDRGNTWQFISEIEANQARCLVAGPGRTIFAVAWHENTEYPFQTWADVIRSDDGGITWTSEMGGLPDGVAPRTLVLDKNDYLYMGTSSNGVFRSFQALPKKPTIFLDHSALSFGEVDFESGLQMQLLTLSNLGDADLITTLSLAGQDANEFTLDAASPMTVNVGSTVPVNITFDPEAPGGYSPREAYLRVEHNDPDPAKDNPMLIPLHGISVPVELSIFEIH